MVSESRPLEMFFIPFVIPSHMMPLLETARLFAARGHHITIITTPAVASSIQKTVDGDLASGKNISIHLVHPPSSGSQPVEKLQNVTEMDAAAKMFMNFTRLRPQIEEFIIESRPDCIVSDMFYPWTVDVAAKLGIPRFFFHVSSVISLALETALRNPDSPQWKMQANYEPFVIPGLPDPITMTRSQLPDSEKEPNRLPPLFQEIKESEAKSYGIIVNSFEELEKAYTEHYKMVVGTKIFNIGPVALAPRSSQNKAESVYKSAVGETECLNWLNSKKPNSVVYSCFGSTCLFHDEQLMEMAYGFENSGHNFIWVVHGKDDRDEEKDRNWLPEGFEERTKDRGMVVRGWAPQVLILGHPSVGGFLTHCGWNSVTEGVCAGLPMITWPIHSEQFYNEKLVTQVLGIGVEVGSEDWCRFSGTTKNMVKREKIAKAVKSLLDGGNEAVLAMREKVKELREMASRAVEEGGSSHKNLTILIEEVTRIRDSKAQG